MTHDATKSLDDLVRPGDVAMLTTVDPEGTLSSRPLSVAEVHGGVLTFLVDANASWFAPFAEDMSDPTGRSARREVIAAISTSRNDWVSVRGRVSVSSDPVTIERLWSPVSGAYFDGPSDPAIRALQVSLLDGEYWSAPGGGVIGRLVAVVGAALSRDDDHAPGNDRGTVARD
jgi:general stress protein 26